MIELAEAIQLATEYAAPGRDRFYGPIAEAGLGTGVFLANVEFPTYLRDEAAYGLLRGLVVVLTHECDLDQQNERVLNDKALVCPVIPLDVLLQNLNAALEDGATRRFVGNVSARYVNRLVYLPVIPDVLPVGGYLYLNEMTNTHLSKLTAEGVRPICMLSRDGLWELDFALQRHLFRPKADRIPFQVGNA